MGSPDGNARVRRHIVQFHPRSYLQIGGGRFAQAQFQFTRLITTIIPRPKRHIQEGIPHQFGHGRQRHGPARRYQGALRPGIHAVENPARGMLKVGRIECRHAAAQPVYVLKGFFEKHLFRLCRYGQTTQPQADTHQHCPHTGRCTLGYHPVQNKNRFHHFFSFKDSTNRFRLHGPAPLLAGKRPLTPSHRQHRATRNRGRHR